MNSNVTIKLLPLTKKMKSHAGRLITTYNILAWFLLPVYMPGGAFITRSCMDGELHFHLNLLYVSIFDTSLTGSSVHMMDREGEGSFLEKANIVQILVKCNGIWQFWLIISTNFKALQLYIMKLIYNQFVKVNRQCREFCRLAIEHT